MRPTQLPSKANRIRPARACPVSNGRRSIRGVIPLIALAFAIPAQASQPHDPAARCGGHLINVESSQSFIEGAWNKDLWQRGAVSSKVRKAWQHKLKCATGWGHRKAMKRRWRKAKHSYNEHRNLMQATRCGTPACNRRLAERVFIKRGIRGSELSCALELGDRESEWDEEVWNFGGSGAYGIAQALPGSKYPVAGQPVAPNGWRKAKVQILWMVDYVSERYRSFCGAIAWHNVHNWY